MDTTNPIHGRITAQSHPDFLVLEPEFDEKKKEYKADIPVEMARKIPGFMSLTPSESQWRVVIVDSVDEMGRGAANAILKILEEPPARAMLILVSHNPGKLLPTIRSRCQKLVLPKLSFEEFRQVLKSQLLDLPDAQLKQLAELADFSPGRAMTLHDGGGVEIYETLEALFTKAPDVPAKDIHSFVDHHLKKEGNWAMLGWVIDRLLTQKITAAAEAGAPTQPWLALWEQATQQWAETSRLYLDKRLVLQQFLSGLSDKKAA